MSAGHLAQLHLTTTPREAAAGLSLFVNERARDVAGLALPRAETHVVARFGPGTREGLDVHVFGARRKAHRKLLRAGQRAVMVRLPLAAAEGVLGVPAGLLAGRVVTLEELWGNAATQPLLDRLSEADDTAEAARLLEGALGGRLAARFAWSEKRRLTVEAARRLRHSKVGEVAQELGMSERHFRRLFQETVGVSPKAFAKLARFHRALDAGRRQRHAGWAAIAAESGYYDQAHLIAEFHALAGATPQGLVEELRASSDL